jgi:ankyrin repeat protein
MLFIFIPTVATTACSAPPIDPKKGQQTIEYKCQPLYMAVKNGNIKVVKNLIKEKSQENKLACIKYALQQKNAYGGESQYQSFRYLVEKLIAMKLPDQQKILNNILKNYAIVYLSVNPEYTEYLLGVGALPKTPNKNGELPVANALWIVNDLGDCKTPFLLINASSPEILAHQNKDGQTALMQAIINTSVCSDEFKLLAKKSSGLDLVDKQGNTALHYILMEIKRYTDMDRKDSLFYLEALQVLQILKKRGASTKIPNNKSITPSQLLRDLQKKGCKC